MSPTTEQELEALGSVEVARLLGLHQWGVPGAELRSDVEAWLRSKELAAAVRKESREEESLSISRKALSISRSAKIWSIIAITVTTINIAVQAYIKYITDLLK